MSAKPSESEVIRLADLTRRACATLLLSLAFAPAGAARAQSQEIGRSVASVAAKQDLAMAHWPSRSRTRAVILALHGFGDAGDLTFDGAAAYWTQRGIAVYAPDQRGFGANASRKRWPGVDALIADAIAEAAVLRRRYPGVPLVVVGHSMGGGVALAAAAAGMDADGLVLAGPAIAGGDTLNPIRRAGAWTLAKALPDRRWTGEGIVRIRVSDNEDALARARADPRHFGDPSSRELHGLVQLMDRAAAAAPSVDIPTLTLMGSRDQVLRPEAVRRIADRIPGSAGFIEYPEGWHWLFRDRQGPKVWSDVADFVLSAAP
jgi:alpha-beta hydrolase superfamily lysophospholipase